MRAAHRTARRRTSIIIVVTAFAMVAALVFAAVSAEGREVSRASSNDGGAWLINRELAVVGHKNRAAGELSSFLRILDSPTADVHQAGDLVVVHDPSTNRLLEVDTRAFNDDLEPTVLPEFSSVHAVDGAVVIVRPDPLEVWRIASVELATLQALDTVNPIQTGQGAGVVTARADGTVVVTDIEAQTLTWHFAAGTSSLPIPVPEIADVDVIDLTIVDASAALLRDDGSIVIVGHEQVEQVVTSEQLGKDTSPLIRLQQPSGVVSADPAPAAAMSVVGIGLNGELVEVRVDGTDAQVIPRGVLEGANPLAPITHDDCIYAVVTDPAQLGIACDQFVSRELEGAGQELRLRLVNGWIWVNDLDDGGTWVTNDSLEVQALEDWGRAEPTQRELVEPPDDEGGDSTNAADTVIVEDPDAAGGVEDADDFDPSEANVAPVAVDDSGRTRVDRAIVVDVLANDSDLNNDILIVTEAELTAGEARVSITASLEEVQVSPAPGFVGQVQFAYSISDGRSEDVSAVVVIDVLSNDAANRAPEARTDVVATAPGHATTIDVLRNDIDPDGDALALRWISTDTGTLRWDPSGQITFTPDTTTASGWIELPYVVVDDLGAEADGLLRVEIRDLGANQEPDARNDQATTVVGRPVAIDLLANDSDPDGDPLIVGSRPRLIEPEGAEVRTTITSDGEFVFEADEPGTYLFLYTINDGAEGGSESDTARVRIDVAPADENDPPIAVRDDIVVAVGDTRTVYVLENDGDPDGDVVSIVDWDASPGLLIAEFNDGTGHVGFQITVTPGARRPTFTYSISDGVNDPVAAPVVVSVVNQGTLDQPPFALDDIVEVRSGTTVQKVDVLANDFDPEGGSLKVVRAGQAPDAQVQIAADAQSVAITVSPGAVTSFTVPYDIEDQAGNRAAAVVRVQLIAADAPNRPPIARTDQARTIESDAVFIDVLRNDSDPDSDAIALEGIVEQPRHGTAGVAAGGLVEYRPDPLFTGTDVFRYALVDAPGDRTIGEVFVGVIDQLGTNLPPIANDDSYVLAGTPAVTPLEVRANDFDPDGDPLRVVDVTSVTHGDVSIDEFGRAKFTPPVRLAVPTVVTFDYVIADTAGNRARASVSIELDAYEDALEPTPAPILEAEPTPEPTPTPDPLAAAPTPTPEPTPDPESINEPPVAVNDERGPVAVGSDVRVNVLDNDFDPDGTSDELSIVSVDGDARIVGRDLVFNQVEETVQVTYTIEDIFGAESSAVVSVVVLTNQAPVVAAFEGGTPYETPLSLDLSAQATDADNDDLFFLCCDATRGGVITDVVASANSLQLTFTPDDGFIGQAAFAYSVDDQQGHQTSGSVTIEVEPPGNRAPIVVANTALIPQGTTTSVDLSELSQDPDGDIVTRRLVDEPRGGISVVIDGSTALITTERDVPIGLAGPFTYLVSDGALEVLGTVEIEIIEGANARPEAVDTSVQVPAAAGTTVDLASLASDSDFGDSISFSLEAASHDPLNVTLAGSLLQINAPASSIDTVLPITFVATDTRGEEASAVVEVTVTSPTQPNPAAIDDVALARRGETVVVDVLANDVDPLGEGLTIIDVEPTWGIASVVDGVLQFSPGDRVGIATVNYTVADTAQRTSSAALEVETVGKPDQPAPPGVTADSRQVTITWTNPAANGRPVTGYTIASNTGEIRTVEVQNTYTWTGLTNGETYTFTVMATNEIGNSLVSEPSLPANPNQAPETPAPPTVAFGDEQLTVTWTAPENAGSEITGYELEIGPTSAIQKIGTNTSFVWQGLTNGQDYTFRVRAENAADFSSFSALSVPEHPAREPDAPAIGQTERGNLSGSLIVHWFKPIDNGDEIIEYRIRALVNGEEIGRNKVAGADTAQFDWSNLQDGVAISFQVQARNRAGWGAWSGQSESIPPCGLPDPVSGVTAVRGDTEVVLTWAAPAHNGCEITGYAISTVEQGGGAIQNTTTPGHTFTGLNNGSDYKFTVQATNERGTQPSSPESNQVTPAGRPICAGSVNSEVNAPRSIDVSWGAAINNGDTITTYLVDQGTGFEPTGSTSIAFTADSLVNGTTYTYKVRARNTVGDSPVCGETSAQTWDVPSAISVSLSFDDVDTVTATATGGQSDGLITHPSYSPTFEWSITGNSAPSPPSPGSGSFDGVPWSFQVVEDDTYVVTLEACNAAGCVSGQASIDIELAAEPDRIRNDEINLRYDTFLGNDMTVEISARVDGPDDNGSDIFQLVWELERPGFLGGEIITGTTVFTGDGTLVNLDRVDGFSDYRYDGRASVNGGWSQTWEFRVAAENSVGVGEFSRWRPVRASPDPPRFDAVRMSAGCGDPSCVLVNFSVYGLQPNETYFVDADGSGGAACTPSVSTDTTGRANGIAECDFDGAQAPGTFLLRIDDVYSNNVS